MLKIVAVPVCVVVLSFAVAGIAVAAMTLRNELGRSLRLTSRSAVLISGWLILGALLLALGWLFSVIAELSH